MPLRTSTTRTLIKYGSTKGGCVCDSNDDNKVKKDSTNATSTNWSTAMLNSNLIWTQRQSGYGGTVRFGNGAARPQIVNYLGRVEGQPGGSGRPPRNNFI